LSDKFLPGRKAVRGRKEKKRKEKNAKSIHVSRSMWGAVNFFTPRIGSMIHLLRNRYRIKNPLKK
jgi:hypothetical protein